MAPSPAYSGENCWINVLCDALTKKIAVFITTMSLVVVVVVVVTFIFVWGGVWDRLVGWLVGWWWWWGR